MTPVADEPGYIPSTWDFVAEHVRRYEETGDIHCGPIEGQPTVLLMTRGRRSGALRKSPVVRVEQDGVYAAVASAGGAAGHPAWFLNLRDVPWAQLQDGRRVLEVSARVVELDERDLWWSRAVAVWPKYDDYRQLTNRRIPVVVLEPVRS